MDNKLNPTSTAVFLTDEQAERTYGAYLSLIRIFSMSPDKDDNVARAILNLKDLVELFDRTFPQSAIWKRDAAKLGML